MSTLPGDTEEPAWNFEAIRELLTVAFSDQELTNLCHDRFYEVYNDLAQGMTKGQKVQGLLDYCGRRQQTTRLLNTIKHLRADQFNNYQARIYNQEKTAVDNKGSAILKQVEDPQIIPKQTRQLTEKESEQAIDFVIIAPLKEERDAILGKLPGYRKLPPSDGYAYVPYAATLAVTFSNYQIGTYNLRIISPLAKGRVQAAHAAVEAIQRWQPRYLLLVGIAGGIAAQGIALGDILIAAQIADYELQKQKVQGSEIRWQVYPTAPTLLAQAQNLSILDWQDLISEKSPGNGIPVLHEGTMTSGDKVVAFEEILAHYKQTWPNLIGVEMEAGGVAAATWQSANRPEFFMIRGASDQSDSEKGSDHVKKWRPYACDVAAAYTIALLENGPVTPQQPSQYVAVEALLSQLREKYGDEAFTILDKLYGHAVARQITTKQPGDFARLIRWFNHLIFRPVPSSRKNKQDFWLFAVLEKHYLLLEGEKMSEYFDNRLTPSFLAHILRQSAYQLEGPMLLLAKYHKQWGTKEGNTVLRASQECLDNLLSIIEGVLEVIKLYAPLPTVLPDDLLDSNELEDKEAMTSLHKLKQTLQQLPAHRAMMRGVSREFKRELEKHYDDLQFFLSRYGKWLLEFAERAEGTLS